MSSNYVGQHSPPSSVSGRRNALGAGISHEDEVTINEASTADNTGTHMHTGDPLVESYYEAAHQEASIPEIDFARFYQPGFVLEDENVGTDDTEEDEESEDAGLLHPWLH